MNPKSNYDKGSEISEPQVDLKFSELQLGIRNFLTLIKKMCEPSRYDEGSEISEPQVDLKFSELQLGIRNFLTLSN